MVRDERKEMIIKVFKPLEETAAWCQGKLHALAAEGPSRLHLRDRQHLLLEEYSGLGCLGWEGGHYVGKKRQGEEGKSQDAEVWMVTHCLFPEIKTKKKCCVCHWPCGQESLLYPGREYFML